MGEKKRQSVTIADTDTQFEFASAKAHRSLSMSTDHSHDDLQSGFSPAKELPQKAGCSSGSERPIESDAESGRQQRSTLADAMTAPTRGLSTYVVDDPTSSADEGDIGFSKRTAQLSITSREMIKKCFEGTTTFKLPQGHPVIALNQEQVNCILKAVADETARASFDMLNSVVTRASQLNLGGGGATPKQQMHRHFSTYSATSATDTDFASEGEVTLAPSETTGGRQSEDEFWNPDLHREPSVEPSSSILFPTPPIPGCSRDDPRSTKETCQQDSPGAQTLADLK